MKNICENCEHYIAFDDMVGVCEDKSLPVFPNDTFPCFIMKTSLKDEE